MMDSLTLFLVVALSVPICLTLLVATAKSLKVSLLVVLLVITFIDLIRKLFGANILLLAAIDASTLLLLFSFYMPTLFARSKRLGVFKEMHPLFKLSLGLYVSIVIIQALNPKTLSLIVTLAGLRSYLLAIPMIGVGWYVAKNWKINDYNTASKVIFVLIVLSVLFGMVSYTIEPPRLPATLANAFMPMEHQVHSFGFANVKLTSSFFASSKRWGRYLLFLYPLAWGHFVATRKRYAALSLSSIVLIGLFLSGSREALVLFAFFHLGRYAISSPGRLLAYTSAVGTLIFALMALYPTGYPQADAQGLILRARFFLSTPEDWMLRARYVFVEPLKILLTAEGNVFTGSGTGSYGQETRLLVDAIPETLRWVPAFARDSGLVKLIVELGVLGLLAFVMLQASILSYARFGKKVGVDPLFTAALLSCVIWLILFLKAHTVISDQMVNIFYWFYVGILIARAALVKLSTYSQNSEYVKGLNSREGPN